MKKNASEIKKFFSTGKVFVTSATMCFLFACSKSSMDAPAKSECSSAPKSFAHDANPIIQTSCAFDSDCHGTGSTSGPGPLLTYSEIFNARHAISSAVASGVMPKDASLSASDKNAILCWIDNGAANN
jgi:hypothetical protein